MINVAPLTRSQQLMLNGRAVWRDFVRCEVDKLRFHLRGCWRALLRQKKRDRLGPRSRGIEIFESSTTTTLKIQLNDRRTHDAFEPFNLGGIE